MDRGSRIQEFSEGKVLVRSSARRTFFRVLFLKPLMKASAYALFSLSKLMIVLLLLALDIE
jgi:hypothetical protein